MLLDSPRWDVKRMLHKSYQISVMVSGVLACIKPESYKSETRNLSLGNNKQCLPHHGPEQEDKMLTQGQKGESCFVQWI